MRAPRTTAAALAAPTLAPETSLHNAVQNPGAVSASPALLDTMLWYIETDACFTEAQG